jgi:hypothetical protein
VDKPRLKASHRQTEIAPFVVRYKALRHALTLRDDPDLNGAQVPRVVIVWHIVSIVTTRKQFPTYGWSCSDSSTPKQNNSEIRELKDYSVHSVDFTDARPSVDLRTLCYFCDGAHVNVSVTYKLGSIQRTHPSISTCGLKERDLLWSRGEVYILPTIKGV